MGRCLYHTDIISVSISKRSLETELVYRTPKAVLQQRDWTICDSGHNLITCYVAKQILVFMAKKLYPPACKVYEKQ